MYAESSFGPEDDDRLQDEIQAISAIYGDDVNVNSTEASSSLVVHLQSDGLTARLELALPRGYPSTTAVIVSVDAPHLPMHSIKAARDRLRHLATTSKGRECGLELIQDAQAALFSDGPAPPGDATSTPQMQRTEVRIDHMNDRAAYAKLLKAWAAPDLGAKLSYRAAPKPNRPRRVEDAMLTLDGPQDAISSFLRRLRTELVDVDSKGKKCKEKCSTVLSQRFLADEKGLVGWSETLTTHAAPSEALPAWVTAAADGCLVDVHVHTGKQETAIARCGDALEVDVSAPPRDGAANDAVCAFFAKLLGVSKSAVTLRQGAKSRSKTLHCRGVTPAQAQRSVSGNAPDTRR